MEFDLLLAAVLVISVVTDVRSRKIYNKVLLPAWLTAIALHAGAEGWHGVAHSLLGCAAGLGLLLIPYLMGGMGAGDVKLLAVVGAIKGAAFVWTASLSMAVIGALLAAILLLAKPGVRQRLSWLAYWGYGLLQGLRLPMFRPDAGTMSASYPYGVAIAGGAVLGWWLQGRGFA